MALGSFATLVIGLVIALVVNEINCRRAEHKMFPRPHSKISAGRFIFRIFMGIVLLCVGILFSYGVCLFIKNPPNMDGVFRAR
jgi:hypothetical protein